LEKLGSTQALSPEEGDPVKAIPDACQTTHNSGGRIGIPSEPYCVANGVCVAAGVLERLTSRPEGIYDIA
jgi:hypothetical protein